MAVNAHELREHFGATLSVSRYPLPADVLKPEERGPRHRLRNCCNRVSADAAPGIFQMVRRSRSSWFPSSNTR
jgi:hypothetical protein